MNPAECAFGISAGTFLGFLVHNKGIEVDPNPIYHGSKASIYKEKVAEPLGNINFLRRFISKSTGKMKAFSLLMWLKDSDGKCNCVGEMRNKMHLIKLISTSQSFSSKFYHC